MRGTRVFADLRPVQWPLRANTSCSPPNPQDVIILNLEDKIRKDILDTLSIPTPKPK